MPKRIALILGILILLSEAAFLYLSFNRQKAPVVLEKKQEEINGDISVLILGQVAEGQGGQWHFAPGLTDTIVLLYYQPNSNTVNLISLPRDLYGSFGDDGDSFKVNEIYLRKDIDEFLKKLPEITGINTDSYIVVDIGMLQKAVDLLGGIDVNLSSTVTDSVSGYKLEKGAHHLNGEDTVWLIRNRYNPEGDFFREKNQHIVIKAIFDEFNKLSPIGKTKFFFRMLPEAKHAEANFSIGELIPKFGDIGNINFNSIVLDFSTGLLKSSRIPVMVSDTTTYEYVLLPKIGKDKYSDIRKFVIDNTK